MKLMNCLKGRNSHLSLTTMANLNKVQLIGNLTRDPELRHTPKGTAIAEISLAINRSWKDDSGNKQEETTFVDVTLWGRTAELAQQYLFKGNPVYIEGRLNLDTWDDKETGKKRSKLKVIGENMQFLGARESANRDPNNGGMSREESSARAKAPRQPASQSATSDSLDQFQDDDDIPF